MNALVRRTALLAGTPLGAPRFIGRPMAESDPLAALAAAFESHHREVAALAGDVHAHTRTLDEVLAQIAALQVGGGGVGPGQVISADQRAHATAFDRFFRHGADAGLRDLEVKASLRTDSDPEGGYLVPDQMESTLDRVLGTISPMRRIARVIQISAGTYKRLVSKGDAAGGWTGERESRPETNAPTLAELSFPAMEVYANPAATQTLLDDSRIDIGAWLADEVSIVFAEKEGTAFISGTGINQPRGLLSYDTVADASWTWGSIGYIASGVAAALNDATHNGTDALIDLVYALKEQYRVGATWLMNGKTAATIRKLKMIGDVEGYLWQPSTIAGTPDQLLGYPVTIDDNMPDIGANTCPIAFGNFMRAYLIVDRVGIRVLRDPFTNKPYVMFYTTKRVGGGVQNYQAVKLLKITAS